MIQSWTKPRETFSASATCTWRPRPSAHQLLQVCKQLCEFRRSHAPSRYVYAHFDGCGVELKLNDHRNKCAVYLEPEVMQSLTEFYKRCLQPEGNS